MQVFGLSKLVGAFFSSEQAVFWFSSQEILMAWQKRKKRLPLTAQSGFAHGQIDHVEWAVRTVTGLCEQEGIQVNQPFAFHTAVVFVATASSPVERKITRRVFQKAGFQKVTLISYATALRAFAQRQAIHTGVGLYVGTDVSEQVVFSPKDQEGMPLKHSLLEASHDIQLLLREELKLEISPETARELYALLGRRKEVNSHVVKNY